MLCIFFNSAKPTPPTRIIFQILSIQHICFWLWWKGTIPSRGQKTQGSSGVLNQQAHWFKVNKRLCIAEDFLNRNYPCYPCNTWKFSGQNPVRMGIYRVSESILSCVYTYVIMLYYLSSCVSSSLLKLYPFLLAYHISKGLAHQAEFMC